MTKKRRCPNCGAYISAGDKACYVCGEKILPVSAPIDTAGKKRTYSPVAYEPEKDNDFVLPADREKTRVVPLKKKQQKSKPEPYYEDNYDDPFIDRSVEPYFYDEDEDFDGSRKKNKKIIIICAAVVAAAVLIAGVIGILFATGVLGAKDNGEEITIYFDKPSVNINILDDQGVVYNWGADVSVIYKYKNKEEEQSASPCEGYNNMWKCTVPAGAEQLYFSQTTGVEIRTEFAQFLENDNVYYVTDILLNQEDRLPISCCKLNEFDNLGVNAVEEETNKTVATTKPKATEKATEEKASEEEEETKEEETKEEETEKEPEPLDNPYNLTVPSSWANGATEVDNGNCITFYEKYNYKNSGSGMLLSIYTFKAGDNSYGNLNAKKVLTASDGSKVVVVTPTDVEFDVDDEKAMAKYTALSNQTNQVIASITTN